MSVPRLLVSVHDVAPATLAESRAWVDHLDRRGVVATLLAVPGPWNGPRLADHAETVGWLRARAASGDEIGLHGWAHRVDAERAAGRRPSTWRTQFGRCVARGAEEFWTIDASEAARRVRAGLDVLADAGLAPVGFTPPGWLIGPHARHAVRTCGLGYVADHRSVHAFASGRRLSAPALSHRPDGFGERLGARAIATIVPRRVDAGRDVRIALHPAEIAHPELVATTLDAIESALARGAISTTYRDAVGLAPAVA